MSCNKSQLETTIDGKKQTLDGYDVILEDTIIFPEGGGQVCMCTGCPIFVVRPWLKFMKLLKDIKQ